MEFSDKDILAIHKQLLVGYWFEYGWCKKGALVSRKAPSPLSKQRVIDGLIKMGDIKLTYQSTHDRDNFERRKVQKGFNGFKFCFACKNPAQVRHHIIWIKNGGRNQKNNIVGLCRECHAEIHPWLKTEVVIST